MNLYSLFIKKYSNIYHEEVCDTQTLLTRSKYCPEGQSLQALAVKSKYCGRIQVMHCDPFQKELLGHSHFWLAELKTVPLEQARHFPET